jgi:hypothetical protein
MSCSAVRGELGALGVGGGVWFGRTERGEPLFRMPAAQLGVGGYGQLALDAGGGFPVGPVGHDADEDALAVPVGLLHSLVAGRQGLVPGRCLVMAGPFGGRSLGVGPGRGQAGFPRAGADLAELVTDPLRRQAVSTG